MLTVSSVKFGLNELPRSNRDPAHKPVADRPSASPPWAGLAPAPNERTTCHAAEFRPSRRAWCALCRRAPRIRKTCDQRRNDEMLFRCGPGEQVLDAKETHQIADKLSVVNMLATICVGYPGFESQWARHHLASASSPIS